MNQKIVSYTFIYLPSEKLEHIKDHWYLAETVAFCTKSDNLYLTRADFLSLSSNLWLTLLRHEWNGKSQAVCFNMENKDTIQRL